MPHELQFDSAGDLFIADRDSHTIRKVDMKTGAISTAAGTGTPGYSGDGGPAAGTAARAALPRRRWPRQFSHLRHRQPPDTAAAPAIGPDRHLCGHGRNGADARRGTGRWHPPERAARADTCAEWRPLPRAARGQRDLPHRQSQPDPAPDRGNRHQRLLGRWRSGSRRDACGTEGARVHRRRALRRRHREPCCPPR